MSDTRGVYALVTQLRHPRLIRIGKLGKFRFEKGFYIYVGSAQNSLEARITRHLSCEKKLRWHIDYLLVHAHVEEVWIKKGAEKSEECATAKILAGHFPAIPGFGAGDCSCSSHLFYSFTPKGIQKLLGRLGFSRISLYDFLSSGEV